MLRVLTISKALYCAASGNGPDWETVRSGRSLQCTWPMQHPMNTYADIDFILPKRITSPEDIPKALLYVDNIDAGNAMIDHLTGLLAKRGSSNSGDSNHIGLDPGIVCPFNPTLSHEHRVKAMEHFCRGGIRIMVCTDAAGMARAICFFIFSTANTATSCRDAISPTLI